MAMKHDEVHILTTVLEGFCAEDEKIVVDRIVTPQGVALYVTVAQDDMRRVIGKEGQVAQALRTIMRMVGLNNGQQVYVIIRDPYLHPKNDSYSHDKHRSTESDTH